MSKIGLCCPRAYVAAHGVGLAQGALDMAIKHVKGRQQFGGPLGAFQGTQFKIAEMAIKVEKIIISREVLGKF